MNNKKFYQAKHMLAFLFLLVSCFSYGQQKVVRLYQGKAPGSESWTWHEQTSDSNAWNTKIVYNVVEPSLMVFPGQGKIKTGTAVIIAPGGGLFALSINSEGTDVAKWLSKKGITAFVLKYRLVHGTNPSAEGYYSRFAPGEVDSLTRLIIPLAMNDGLAAVAYVRQNAAAYKINPAQIGLMGFSAGGGLTMSVAYNATDENRPNFIAPIYAWDKDITGTNVPKQNMPAFIAVASDDHLGLVPTSIDIYNKWIAAKQPAELHIYQTGGHGFGMRKQNIPTDTWIERFGDWLKSNKLL